MITLITDGSGTTTGSPGGWACILRDSDATQELFGGDYDTTSQLMELAAIENGLRAVPEGATVNVITDSQCAIGWVYGWDTEKKCPDPTKLYKRKEQHIIVACRRIDKLIVERKLTISFTWVKGHAGHPDNERCDVLACHERETRQRFTEWTPAHRERAKRWVRENGRLFANYPWKESGTDQQPVETKESVWGS